MDYIIYYDGETGYCTIEWSIPLNVFLKDGGGAGSELQFTLWATGGTSTVPDFSTAYGVVLGDFGFMVNQKNMNNHVTYVLTDEYTVPPQPPIMFIDVPDDAYFKAPVDWAVSKGITKGTGESTFSPEDPCTRGQVVTFLWRAAGEPEPTAAFNRFSDVKEDDYFYKAVLWAIDGSITMGTSDYTFSPDAPCTRAEIVTFLYRYAKGSAAEAANPFTDVASADYFYAPVMWAVANKITTGTSNTTFSPNDTCTRAQVVTFLYRNSNK